MYYRKSCVAINCGLIRVNGVAELTSIYFIADGMGLKRDYKQALKFFNLASQSGMQIHFFRLTFLLLGSLLMFLFTGTCPMTLNLQYLSRYLQFFSDGPQFGPMVTP